MPWKLLVEMGLAGNQATEEGEARAINIKGDDAAIGRQSVEIATQLAPHPTQLKAK